MGISSGLSGFLRAAARPTPPRRLRVMYWCALALCAALLIMLHISIAGERRLSTELAAATRAELATPHIIVVRLPPTVRAAVKSNIHAARARHPAARRKEK